MANIERSAAVILRDVVLIRRKAAGASGVAVCMAQRVIAKQRKFRTEANAAVHDELILFEDSRSLHLINVFERSERTFGNVGGVECWTDGRVDVSSKQGVNAA